MASRLERLIGIEKIIRTGQFPSVSDLCGMFEIQPRTLFQDIKELRENIGCQIKFDRARQGYYSTNPQHALPAFSLTEDELFVLALAARLLSQTSDASIATQLQAALTKIIQNSHIHWHDQLIKIANIIQISNTLNSNAELSKLRSICEACIKSQVIVINTDSGAAEHVEPYYLEYALSRWFLIGYARSSKQIFHRDLDSITSYATTEINFERRQDLNA
ncbi:MAG: hypothetical protein K2W82_01900 [Candidatus Obscuribacterales bacterium]|nr:hypothetical protein [Candidatus Obscuribacterales bacterium]